MPQNRAEHIAVVLPLPLRVSTKAVWKAACAGATQFFASYMISRLHAGSPSYTHTCKNKTKNSQARQACCGKGCPLTLPHILYCHVWYHIILLLCSSTSVVITEVQWFRLVWSSPSKKPCSSALNVAFDSSSALCSEKRKQNALQVGGGSRY